MSAETLQRPEHINHEAMQVSKEVKSETEIAEQVGRIVDRLAVRVDKLDPLKEVPRTHGWEHKASLNTDNESVKHTHRPMGSDTIVVEQADGTKHTAQREYKKPAFSTQTRKVGDILEPSLHASRRLQEPETLSSPRTGKAHLTVKGVTTESGQGYYDEAKPDARQEAIRQSAHTLGKIRGAVVRAEQAKH